MAWNNVLCVYYSRTGNTKKAMEEIAQALGAELGPQALLPRNHMGPEAVEVVGHHGDYRRVRVEAVLLQDLLGEPEEEKQP